jgi:hypothetical protein
MTGAQFRMTTGGHFALERPLMVSASTQYWYGPLRY